MGKAIRGSSSLELGWGKRTKIGNVCLFTEHRDYSYRYTWMTSKWLERSRTKSILRKSTDMPKPIQRVKFRKAIARHTKIRDPNPSLGYICPGEPHQRSPNAPKFEDRSQEETEWQEQGAREAAWKLAKSVFKLKEHERATFFSPSENRCLPASTLKPEEREFVVDSGVDAHDQQKGLESC